MSNRVYLWVDQVSEESPSKISYQTSICVHFEDQNKYVFSYNERGYWCNQAEQDERPKEEIHLGDTTCTLAEVEEHAENLYKTKFKECGWTNGNCNQFANELSLRLLGKSIPTKYGVQGEVAAGAVVGVGVVAAGTILGALFRR